MSAITLKGTLTALQQNVIDLTNCFDTNPDKRHEIYSYAQASSAWKPSREETDTLPSQLKDLGSSIWLREKTRQYLCYLDYVLSQIRGEEGTAFVLPETIRQIIALEKLRSNWLKFPEFRDSVETLAATIENALNFFNVQIICQFVQEAIRRSEYSDDKPSFYPAIPLAQAYQELFELEDMVYRKGKTIYRVDCAQAYHAMVHVPNVPQELLRFLTFTPEQLTMIAAHGRGQQSITAETVLRLDPPLPQPEPEWKETASGLIIPGSSS